MTQFEHWIEGITAEDSVSHVARHSLRVRLAAVQHYLSLAAERSDEDVEYVHQLRVCTRRAMAALKLYTGLLPNNKAKWFRKTLRKIRSVAGDARDLDVLVQSHETDTGTGAAEFIADVRQRRKAAQTPIVAVYRMLELEERLRLHVEALLEKTAEKASHSAAGSFGPWATQRFRKLLKRFFKASPSDLDDLPSLHRFRIRGKELRYAMELLAPAFPAAFREELYPVIEELQERLGEIHDHAVARVRFDKWVTETKSKREADHVRKLRKQEREKLDKLLRDFASWWTREFEADLHDTFRRVIDRSVPEVTA
jgi:CHAD domain-containing protein